MSSKAIDRLGDIPGLNRLAEDFGEAKEKKKGRRSAEHNEISDVSPKCLRL